MAGENHACPLCGGQRLEPIVHLPAVPVLCNQLWPTAEAGRDAPAGEMDLVLCGGCALIFNRAFSEDLIDYAPGYENALHFSPRFQAFADQLCSDLVACHGLAGRDVVEIGCGDGFILEMMVRKGVRTATGFDPSMLGKPSPHAELEGVEIVPEHFRADQLDRDFDVVLCRHVLEHLPAPLAVLGDVRAAIGDRACPIYFEVPNAAWILDSRSIWDVIYEHVSYWTPVSMGTLYRRAGFEPSRTAAGYGGQFLMMEGTPASPRANALPAPAEVEAVRAATRAFANAVETERDTWSIRLAGLAAEGKRALIWGAGSKGIAFSNMVSAPPGTIAAMVDVNARKHGMFTPGAGLRVAAPDEVAALAPDLVLIANELYADEIAATVSAQGISPEFAVIAG